MKIVRGNLPSDNFTIISNAAARDQRLSYRARGVLLYLLGHAPGWSTSSDAISAGGAEGRVAIQKAMKELENLGYMVRTKEHADKGRWLHLMTVTDTPTTGQNVVDGLIRENALFEGEIPDGTTRQKTAGGRLGDIKNTSERKPKPSATDDDTFAQAWAAYPRKVGKQAALKQYRLTIKRGAKPNELLVATQRFAAHRAAEIAAGTSQPQFTMYPSKFWGPDAWWQEHLSSDDGPATDDLEARRRQRIREANAQMEREQAEARANAVPMPDELRKLRERRRPRTDAAAQ